VARRPSTRRALAAGAALLSLLSVGASGGFAAGCGGDGGSGTGAATPALAPAGPGGGAVGDPSGARAGADLDGSVPDLTTSAADRRSGRRRSWPESSGGDRDERGDAGHETAETARARVRAAWPAPTFGPGPVAPASTEHPVRMVFGLEAMRASPSGAKLARVLGALPPIVDTKARTGIDPLAHGTWLLVYGSSLEVPGPNANVLRTSRTDAEIGAALADAGLGPTTDAGDAGAAASHGAFPDAGIPADVAGVRDVLLRPQPRVIALVPSDRAADLAVALARPIDPGLKPRELARIAIHEPGKLGARGAATAVLAPLVRLTVALSAATDGGLDVAVDGDCKTAAECADATMAANAALKTLNTIGVRIVLGGLLNGVVVKADGARARAGAHVTPAELERILNLATSALGVSVPDPPDPRH